MRSLAMLFMMVGGLFGFVVFELVCVLLLCCL